MIVIGEKLNSSRERVREAINSRDAETIRRIAASQAAAGADFLDVNCAMGLDRERADLEWVIKTVRQVTPLPLCLDSPNPEALAFGLSCLNGEDVFINSVTREPSCLDKVLPLVRAAGCRLVALAVDGHGVPADTAGRLNIVRELRQEMDRAGIAPEKVYYDPVVQPVSTQPEQAKMFLEALRRIKQEGLQTICGLSNVSFGLPRRGMINSAFLAMLMAEEIDAVIIDPADEAMRLARLAADVLLDRDEYCRNYLRYLRENP